MGLELGVSTAKGGGRKKVAKVKGVREVLRGIRVRILLA